MVGKNPAAYIAKTEGGKGRSIRFIEDGQPGELATMPTKTDFPLIVLPAKARRPNCFSWLSQICGIMED